MSRGLPPAGRLATLPCPVGKGRCRYAGSTLFALRAKALQSGAPDHGVSRERAGFSERFAHQGNLPARRGTGERAAPRRGRRYTPSRGQNAPSPGKTFRIILPPQTRRSTRHASLPAFRGEPPDACLQLSAPVYSQPAPFTTCLRRLRRILRPLRRIPRPLQRIPRRLPAHPTPFAAYSALFTAYSAPFTAFPHLLRPLHACLRPIRAFNSHPVPFYGFPTPFTTTPTPVYDLTARFTTTPRRALYGPYCAFYDLSASFAAHLCLLWPSRACLRLFCTFYSPSAPAKGSFPPFPLPAHPPGPSRRENGGLCPHPLKGPTLENPFLENDLHCIRLPVPQNAAGGRPLLLGRPPCVRSVAGIETKRSTQAPYSWGLGA